MGVARLLILSEERLIGRGLAALLASRFETHSIESFQRLGRLLDSERVEVALWLGDRLDAQTVHELETLKDAHPALRLCLLARAADIDALRPLLHDHPRGVAVLFRSGELDVGQVVGSLNEVLAGRSILEPAVLERLLDNWPVGHHQLARLTPAEREVLELVAQGLRNREIARRIWKSEKAVEKQVSHLFKKLGLDQETAPHLDRRVTAARIFFSARPRGIAAAGSSAGRTTRATAGVQPSPMRSCGRSTPLPDPTSRGPAPTRSPSPTSRSTAPA
jgi:DNA-binding NarL/FixJ family response regulator